MRCEVMLFVFLTNDSVNTYNDSGPETVNVFPLRCDPSTGSTVNCWPGGPSDLLCGQEGHLTLWGVSESWLALTNDWQLIFDFDWPHWLRERLFSGFAELWSCCVHFLNFKNHSEWLLYKKTHTPSHLFRETHLSGHTHWSPSYPFSCLSNWLIAAMYL